MSICRKIDVKLIEEWKENSKKKLKDKSNGNIKERALKLEESVNNAIENILINDINININEPIKKFKISSLLMKKARNTLFNEISKWQGVNVMVKQIVPKTWKEYHITADNWWNRNKAKWIGDYFFTPILKNELKQYIINTFKINNNKQELYNLLYFSSLENMMKSDVKFHRTRNQPLILDQSFKLSKQLRELFIKLGIDHNYQWNVDRGCDAKKIRKYVQDWIKKILTIKQSNYNDNNNNNHSIAPSLTTNNSYNTFETQEYNNHNHHGHNDDDDDESQLKLDAQCVIITHYNNDIPSPQNIEIPSLPLSSLPSSSYYHSSSRNRMNISSLSRGYNCSRGYNGYHSTHISSNNSNNNNNNINGFRNRSVPLSVEGYRYHPYNSHNSQYRLESQYNIQSQYKIHSQYKMPSTTFEWQQPFTTQQTLTTQQPFTINNENNFNYASHSPLSLSTYN